MNLTHDEVVGIVSVATAFFMIGGGVGSATIWVELAKQYFQHKERLARLRIEANKDMFLPRGYLSDSSDKGEECTAHQADQAT